MDDKITSMRPASGGLGGLCATLLRTFGIGILATVLTGCDNYRIDEKCSDYIARGDRGKFVTDDSGLAKDIETGTTWYRCAAGKTFSNYRCKGQSLYLDWDDATAYAEEFSQKSGIKWRLPTNDETYNHWTSSNSRHQKSFKCSINTYNGSLTCRQARVLEQPFLLVQD